ncbi:MAG: TolC family protein [Chitinophagaceae bacterium]|nr:TolC family protein [Chitinophagaceae bacterium]
MLNNLWNLLVKIIWSCSFFLLLSPIASAQDAMKKLSLKEAIDSALRNNKDIRLAGWEEKIAVSKWKETHAIFLPQLDLSYSAMNTNNPLNVFGFKLQQQSVKAEDFNPALLNSPGGYSDFASKLQLKQPVFNMDLLYMRKAAASQTDIYKFKTQRTKEYLVFEVKKAYMQLQLSYDAIDVLQEALKTANAMYTFTSNRVQEGLMQQSDALNVKVWITSVETNLAEAKSGVQNASDYLSLLMGRSIGTTYETEKIDTENIIVSDTSGIPVNRSDFAAMKKAIETSDLMIRSSKMSYLPKINAFGSYQFNDSRILGFGADSYLAGIQLTWDVFKGNSTKNKIATQTLERDKLAEQLTNQQEQSQLELNKTTRQLADAQYKISQQNAAVKSAAEALRILQDRYEQGLVNSTDVLLSQTQLSQQKLGLAQAIFNQNTTAAYISFLTATSN